MTEAGEKVLRGLEEAVAMANGPPLDGTVFMAHVTGHGCAPGPILTAMAYYPIFGYQPTLWFHGHIEAKEWEILKWWLLPEEA